MKGFCPDTRAHGAQQTTELRRRARRAHTRLFIVPPARPRRPPRASPVAACGDTGGRGSGGRNHCLMIETHSNETTRTPGIGKRRSRPSWAERCPVPHWLQCATVCTRDTASALGLERERGRPGRRSARLGASDRARAIEPRSHETCARMSSNRRSPLRGRAAGIAVCIPCGIRHGYGTRGISHPQPGRRLRAPPNNPTAASGPGGRWGV